MKTNKHTHALVQALAARYGTVPPSTLNHKEAMAHAKAFNAANPDEAVKKSFNFGPRTHYVTVGAAKEWFAVMSSDTRENILRDEVLMGWFQSDYPQGDDTADVDGDFMSTPCCSGYDDLEDIYDALEHCSRCDLIVIEDINLTR